MPLFTVIAGPNGSGKSTLVNSLSFEGKENLLNPDIVAAELSPGDVQKAALAAGRIVLTRTQQLLEDRQSFATETTLPSKKIIQTLSLARDLGFTLSLVYVSLDNPSETSVVCRFASQKAVTMSRRRRPPPLHTQSLIATEVIKLVDHAIVFDNSGPQHRKILAAAAGVLKYAADDLPTWALPLRAALTTRDD